ncbi:MAG TPA: MaoC family dehydratase [Microvirga sp.]|jgi:acyl dehydratase|nr:MaoC family dehydratase [Microvirga sp.]
MLRVFEHFPVGWSATFGPVAVTQDAIVAFAREFDPQPFHMDEEAAKGTFVGGLIGSGWHTCALNMRLIADGFLNGATSMGAPGVEEVKWVAPVRPGDELRTRVSVVEARPSKSRPEIGLLHFTFEVVNQRGETVLHQTNWIMFGRGGHPWPPSPGSGPKPGARAVELELAPPRPAAYLDEMVVGEASTLGTHTFTAEDIVRFARQFDPQPFHLDEEAARRSLFGGLCASGWHTAAVWMRLMIGYRERAREEARRRGERPPELGPSPGFKNLKWSKPVYAGDTITYCSAITGTRASASRPGWGLAFHRNSGVNQHGEEVFSFDGAVFWERRPAEAQASAPRSS